MSADRPFWQSKRLDQMNDEEWESLCDGCARCCLHKLQDIDSGEIAFTDVACRLLDTTTCRCKNYAQRTTIIPECVRMTPAQREPIAWLPRSCAYRRLAEGRELASWHPLVSGDPESVHRAGISVRGRCVDEHAVRPDDIEARIAAWVHWRPLREK